MLLEQIKKNKNIVWNVFASLLLLLFFVLGSLLLVANLFTALDSCGAVLMRQPAPFCCGRRPFQRVCSRHSTRFSHVIRLVPLQQAVQHWSHFSNRDHKHAQSGPASPPLLCSFDGAAWDL